jgi:hypothetical protein
MVGYIQCLPAQTDDPEILESPGALLERHQLMSLPPSLPDLDGRHYLYQSWVYPTPSVADSLHISHLRSRHPDAKRSAQCPFSKIYAPSPSRQLLTSPMPSSFK